jgi:2-(3-amino-3-carboxypropyl)histidine synthase
MKVLYIEARKKSEKTELSKETLKTLPKELFLAYSIQYKSQATKIKRQLESNDFKIVGFNQVLGCTKLKTNSPILLIGSGRFHALNLALQSDYPIYIYSNGTISKVEESEIKELKKNKQGSISKFFSAERVGIIFSTKPGQYNSKEEIIEKLIKNYPEKRFFSFISNNINTAEFENFKIDFWLNTACPGLTNDSTKIENIDDVFGILLS